MNSSLKKEREQKGELAGRRVGEKQPWIILTHFFKKKNFEESESQIFS